MSAVLEYPQRHAVTTEEFPRMGEAGVFGPQARREPIEEGIVEMAPRGSAHASAVILLNRLLAKLAGDAALVSVQNPFIASARSVPQPDIALLRLRADSYTKSHPAPADVLLVLEVSDTTLAYDLDTKVPLYARAGIPEAWVVDSGAREVRVSRDPARSGYRTSFTAGIGETVGVRTLPEVRFAVAELFAG